MEEESSERKRTSIVFKSGAPSNDSQSVSGQDDTEVTASSIWTKAANTADVDSSFPLKMQKHEQDESTGGFKPLEDPDRVMGIAAQHVDDITPFPSAPFEAPPFDRSSMQDDTSSMKSPVQPSRASSLNEMLSIRSSPSRLSLNLLTPAPAKSPSASLRRANPKVKGERRKKILSQEGSLSSMSRLSNLGAGLLSISDVFPAILGPPRYQDSLELVMGTFLDEPHVKVFLQALMIDINLVPPQDLALLWVLNEIQSHPDRAYPVEYSEIMSKFNTEDNALRLWRLNEQSDPEGDQYLHLNQFVDAIRQWQSREKREKNVAGIKYVNEHHERVVQQQTLHSLEKWDDFLAFLREHDVDIKRIQKANLDVLVNLSREDRSAYLQTECTLLPSPLPKLRVVGDSLDDSEDKEARLAQTIPIPYGTACDNDIGLNATPPLTQNFHDNQQIRFSHLHPTGVDADDDGAVQHARYMAMMHQRDIEANKSEGVKRMQRRKCIKKMWTMTSGNVKNWVMATIGIGLIGALITFCYFKAGQKKDKFYDS